MENQDQEQSVRFGGGNPTGVFGIIAGAAIALGVPWIMLAHGQVLGVVAQVWVSIVGIALGASVALTSAFFGLVMPSKIAGHLMDPEKWKQWKEWAEEHKERKRGFCGCGLHGRRRFHDSAEDVKAPAPAPRSRKR
jgi:hypothetical protein